MQKDKITFNKVISNGQKAIIISLFAVSIILFVYSLLYFTPFYDAYLIDNSAVFAKNDLASYGINIQNYIDQYPDAIAYNVVFGSKSVKGINVGYFTVDLMSSMQSFNKALFAIAFFGIVGSLILFIYRSQKRKRYYITNFITVGIVIAFDLFASIFTLINIFKYMNIFSTQFNYEITNAYQTSVYSPGSDVINYFSFQGFSWVFIVGIVLCVICILIAVLGIVFLVKKYLHQKKVPALDISGVIINE